MPWLGPGGLAGRPPSSRPGDGSSAAVFGMCCGCGQSPTFQTCAGINCSGTDYLVCDLPRVYRVSLSGFTFAPAGCCPGGSTFTHGYLGYASCYNWQNFHPDNAATPSPGQCCFAVNSCGGGAGWGMALQAWCSGTFGAYALTEPCWVLTIQRLGCFTAYYICPLAGYNCSGSNVFDLVDDGGSTDVTFPASVTLQPVTDPACFASC